MRQLFSSEMNKERHLRQVDYLSGLCLGSFLKVVYTIIWVDHFFFFFFTFVLFLSDNFGSNKGMVEGRN